MQKVSVVRYVVEYITSDTNLVMKIVVIKILLPTFIFYTFVIYNVDDVSWSECSLKFFILQYNFQRKLSKETIKSLKKFKYFFRNIYKFKML